MGFAKLPGPHPERSLPSNAVGPLRTVSTSAPIPYEASLDAQDSGGQGGFDLWNLIGVLIRRKLLILATIVVGVAAAAILTLREVPVYEAVATLEVQERATQIMQGAGVEPAGVANAEFISTQIALMKSRALAERVAKTLNLTDEPRYSDQSANAESRLSQAASQIVNGLSISPMRGARVIEVRFESSNAEETARIANAIGENFIEMDLERRYSATAYARRFLEERLATTKLALENTERKLFEYSRDEGIFDLTSVGGSASGSSLDASSLVSINASLTEAQNRRIIAQHEYREAIDNPSTREMLQSPAIQALRQTRSQLLFDYQSKLNTLRPEHPEMIELQSRIAAIEREVESERTNIVQALQTEYRAAVAREDALAVRVEELKGQVQELRGRSIDYNILAREADTLRGQYDALLQRMKEVSIADGVGTSQVSILDRAEQPFDPFKPNLASSLIRAFALSLALAVALAFLIEFLDDRIKTPDDVTSKLGLRVVGVIPRVKSYKSISKLLRNPREMVAEAVSSTRAQLQFAIMQGSLKSLLVTSSRPSEGKTTTSLALASSFAAIGKKVLIIDADLRRPSFAYDSNVSAGLSGMLSQGLPLADNLVPGPTPNLFLLPAGAVPPNPAELLADTRMMHLLEEAGRQFDLIIIDSPPVLIFADAPILNSVCDGTIFVVQSRGVLRQTARKTLERLHDARANIIGAVLTKFDIADAAYKAAYGYGASGYSESDYRKAAAAPTTARRVRDFSQADSAKHHRPTGNWFAKVLGVFRLRRD